MKSDKQSQWRSIIVLDNSNQEICSYELDEFEKLQNKMKRQKKRSIHIRLKNSKKVKTKIRPPSIKKYEFFNQLIFSLQKNTNDVGINTINNINNSKFDISNIIDNTEKKANNNIIEQTDQSLYNISNLTHKVYHKDFGTIYKDLCWLNDSNCLK